MSRANNGGMMSRAALSEFVRFAKYANHNPVAGRRETWKEQVKRMFDMHRIRYAHEIANSQELSGYIDTAEKLVLAKKLLGSQRALQYGGKPILQKNARLYNCSATYADRYRFFQELVYLTMCGCGVGFSVQYRHANMMPKFRKPSSEEVTFVIPDTMEGWADAVGALISSYADDAEKAPFPQFVGKTMRFDYSKLRPEGSKIASGGKSPGPEPLRRCIESCQKTINGYFDNEDVVKLRPIQIYDLAMYMAGAVVSGGVRRSATICLFSLNDNEMIEAKTGNYFEKSPHWQNSNNSAVLIRGKVTKEQFDSLFESTKQFGEPGFIWAENEDVLFNPCVTGDTMISTSKGLERAKDLAGKQFTAVVDGIEYISTENGFWITGIKPTLEITTSSGRVLNCTDSHKIMIEGPDDTSHWKEAGELIVGEDRIRISNNQDVPIAIDKNNKDVSLGWITGNFIGDGCTSKKSNTISAILCYWGENRYHMLDVASAHIEKVGFNSTYSRMGSKNTETKRKTVGSKALYNHLHENGCFTSAEDYGMGKHISSKLESGTNEYLAGVIAGYFDADGHVEFGNKCRRSIRISSNKIDNLRALQRMASRLGIQSRIYNRREAGYTMMPDGHGGLYSVFTKKMYALIISRKSILRFAEIVPIEDLDKISRLKTLVSEYVKPFSDELYEEVVSVSHRKEELVYDCTIPGISAFAANGIYVHNCSEIGMAGYVQNGNLRDGQPWEGDDYATGKVESGVEFCNLSEVNGGKTKTKEEFFEACIGGAILGTLQAGYTEIGYLTKTSIDIIKKEALIGVSITGIMENPEILLNAEIQQRGAELIKEWNKKVSLLLGINQAARCTCVKPSGTASSLLETSPGIHPHHSKRYLRRVRANRNETALKFYKGINPSSVESDHSDVNNMNDVITFACETSKSSRTKIDTSAIELLKAVHTTQKNWVEYGTNENLSIMPCLRHNVSNTIDVGDSEWDEVRDYLYENQSTFAGVSMLPTSGDKIYNQAPYANVMEAHEIIKEYGPGAMMASGLIVEGMKAWQNDLWAACDSLTGVKSMGYKLNANDAAQYYIMGDRHKWVSMAKNFSDKYFDSNINKMVMCLKEVQCLYIWEKIVRNYKDVDWSECVESVDGTKIQQDVACAGGACEITAV